ncbi:lysylphosphatidylglycerol synthase transmembrane domain-containing protein [Methanosarcina horonobensis]|uniref:lysylphosphatidylglycerol synthase transmembrane domain-containing protein n=1 Tax=Methanosarcina horonobensis TaxID=418008 RepID=UPI0022B88DB4|nr:lysylphosphatidylglycerol synthase transmembrane domain-containing protein [Methanosarcina horonobensis]
MKYITGKKFITVLATFFASWNNIISDQNRGLIATIKNIDKTYLVLGFFLYVLSYLLRGLRFHILLDKKISLTDLFHIVCVHNMVNSILPARSGELSYIYILKKYHDKSTGEGVATLMVARVLDFITISLLFFYVFFICT